MPIARVKLTSIDIGKLNSTCGNIKEIAGSLGVNLRGPIPLPTKRLKITTRKSPCGDGKATFDRYEMRIYKRIIDLPMDDKVLRQVMRLLIPREVNMEVEMID